VDDTPRFLKVFVILGGILLLAGTVFLVVLLVLRIGGNTPMVRPLPAEVALPPGTKVEQMELDGERLVLLVEDREGRQLLLMVHAITGERLGLLELRPEE
jgi:hypothetical protein